MISTPDICDNFANVDVITSLYHYGKTTSFFGPVATVDCLEDNSLIREEVLQPGNGRVLVVSGKKSRKVALLGDNIASIAVRNQWSGIVIDGCIRDIEALAHLPIGIMALGSCPRRSKKENKGTRGQLIIIDQVKIKPDDWLYADKNGIVVSPSKIQMDNT